MIWRLSRMTSKLLIALIALSVALGVDAQLPSDPAGKGEISDAVMLKNGNILFAHQFGLTEITPDKKVVWNYEPPTGHEVHTAVPIGNDRVLYIQNGDPALLRVVKIVTGVTEKEIRLRARQR